jgi:hypothetical protein
MGDHSAATSRGFAAVAGNPAGLGMPRASRVTAAALPVSAACALGPVTCADVADWDDDEVPHAVREEWLRRIEAKGRQTGRFGGGLTLAAATLGWFGFQIATEIAGGADLNPDAAELMLFGSAGRTGDQREFTLAGSSFDTYAVTTAALGVGIPLDIEIGDAPAQAFAVGATVKYTLGNALYLARDLRGFVSGDPLDIWLRFPVLQTRGTPTLRAGKGASLDVGFQWEASPWSFGLTARNVVSTFRWSVDDLVFRPGTTLLTQEESESDFTPRPASEAPDALLEHARAFRFGPRVALGFQRALGERTTFAAELDARLGQSSDHAPPTLAGMAVEHRPLERIALRAHASAVNSGFRVGGGVGARLGDVDVSGAWTHGSRQGLGGPTAMLTVSLGGG